MQDALDSSKEETKRMEARVSEQSEQVVSLMEANNALSAKTLTLAAEPEAIRVRLEAQISELRQQLKNSEEQVDAMHMSEQTQRVALLDELNSMQTENSQLREQLRSKR
jgi:predicted  nucleic acid-binding Zn-ribbon protein